MLTTTKVKMKTTDKKERGKKARQSGGIFERRVRANLEEQEWIVTKWYNQVDFEKDRIIPAPHKFNFFTKSITPGQGFPDFVCYKQELGMWTIIGVESKSAKYLDKEEKLKCKWYKDHEVFDQILIAYKDKKGHVVYYEYKEEENEKPETQ